MFTIDPNLDSPTRQLIALQVEHSDLNAMIDATSQAAPLNELALRRLKKKRLALRDKIARLKNTLIPDDQA